MPGRPPQHRPVVTQADIEAGLRELGLRDGDVAMAHSSLSSFGWVDGGAPTVIRAMLAVVGPRGTIVMPTLCQRDLERRFELWDIERSPSDVGRITETLRLWPGARRSDHPTHSVAAVGRLAEFITASHASAFDRPSPWGERAFGFGSPWERLYELDALYIFFGVTFRYCTMLHFVQAELCRQILAPLDDDARARFAARLRDWQRDGLWPNFSFEEMGKYLARPGHVRETTIGAARCLSIRTQTLVREALRELHTHPSRWLPDDFLGWWQKAAEAAQGKVDGP